MVELAEWLLGFQERMWEGSFLGICYLAISFGGGSPLEWGSFKGRFGGKLLLALERAISTSNYFWKGLWVREEFNAGFGEKGIFREARNTRGYTFSANLPWWEPRENPNFGRGPGFPKLFHKENFFWRVGDPKGFWGPETGLRKCFEENQFL